MQIMQYEMIMIVLVFSSLFLNHILALVAASFDLLFIVLKEAREAVLIMLDYRGISSILLSL